MTVDPTAPRGRRDWRWWGRSESGSGGEARAAAEGRARSSRWEGHTRCSCRDAGRRPRGRKGNTCDRLREGGKDGGTGGGRGGS